MNAFRGPIFMKLFIYNNVLPTLFPRNAIDNLLIYSVFPLYCTVPFFHMVLKPKIDFATCNLTTKRNLFLLFNLNWYS